jgi:hypothetical protein
MGAENGDQLGWDGHPAGFIRSTLLQPALIVGESLSLQRRVTSGRDFSKVSRPHPVAGRWQSCRSQGPGSYEEDGKPRLSGALMRRAGP